MKELTRTNDTVFISWLEAELRSADISAIVLDTHASIVEGSISAIPRRVMVADEDHEQARLILAEGERLRRGDAPEDD